MDTKDIIYDTIAESCEDVFTEIAMEELSENICKVLKICPKCGQSIREGK